MHELREDLHAVLQTWSMSLFHKSWFDLEAMLKMTDIKLELITDIDVYRFIEKGLRGGVRMRIINT